MTDLTTILQLSDQLTTTANIIQYSKCVLIAQGELGAAVNFPELFNGIMEVVKLMCLNGIDAMTVIKEL